MGLSQAEIDALARKGARQGIDLVPGLTLVERRLRERVVADLPFLQDSSRHLIEAGGKRFRPMLVLLCGLLGREPTDDGLVDAAVVVELVHLSTLYHDDVIDQASTRRGAPAAHVRWSNTVAILTGDFLLARASLLSAALGVEVTRIMAATIADLCQGQIREVQGSAADRGTPAVVPDRAHYLAVIREKTASLISASCRLGGLLSDQPPAVVEALTDYGWHLGMSFQLADDVLDITGDGDESGKLPGTDLRQGVRTLPVLLALEADGPDSRLARRLVHAAPEHVDEALAILRAHPAMDLARDAARLESVKAKRVLRRLDGELAVATRADGPSPAAVVEALAALADHAVERDA